MGSMCVRAADEFEGLEAEHGQDLPPLGCVTLGDAGATSGKEEGAATTPRRQSSASKSTSRAQSSRASEAATSDISQWELQDSRELLVADRRRRGRSGTTNRHWDPATAVAVELHVYDIGTSGRGSCINRLLRPFGTGAFHCGVEVYNCEWSFSDTTSRKETTGVFKCAPRECKGHTYCESVLMGRTSCSQAEVKSIVELLQQDWRVEDYDLLRRNCCHFADELCWRLGVGAIPSWVTNLAANAASFEDAGERFYARGREACSCTSLCCASTNDPAWPGEVKTMPIETVESGGPTVDVRNLQMGFR